MTPEFSRAFALDTIGTGGHEAAIEAELGERAALSRRFGWIALENLTADAVLTQRGAGIDATGRLRARVTQACVVTGEGVPAAIDQKFALRFVATDMRASLADEVELSSADLDTIAYEGGAIDLGEAVAQTLALALEPFPKTPGADDALKEAGVVSEAEACAAASPFAALKNIA